MSINIIKSMEEFYSYKNDYNKILEENSYNSPFTSFSFITKWWEYFGDNYSLFIIILEENSIIQGFSPLMIKKNRFYKEINFIGYPYSSNFDFIFENTKASYLVSLVLDFLYSLKGYIINLKGLKEDSSNYIFIKKWAKTKNKILFTNYTLEPYLKINNASHISKERNKINLREKKLKELGIIEYREIFPKEFDKIFSIHEDRWRLRYDTSNFSKESFKGFIKSIYNEDSPDSHLIVNVISLCNEPIAYTLGFINNKTYYLYSFSYYNSFSYYGLGKLILKYKIEECYNLGLSIFNFGIGDEPFKREWGKNSINLYNLIFTSSSLPLVYSLFYIKTYAINWIKKRRKLINFRRNTLGKIKYNILNIRFTFLFRKLFKYLILPFGILYSLFSSEKNKVIILLYHRINRAIPQELSVNMENFLWQMNYINKHNINILSMDKYINNIEKGSFPDKNIVISFDDGYKDFYIYAYPLLKRLNFPCILYVVPGFIDNNKVFWWDRDISKSEILNWEQIKMLNKDNIITIGSHSMNHYDLRNLDEYSLKEELLKSKEVIESNLGENIIHFSYPQGLIDKKIIESARIFYKSGVEINSKSNNSKDVDLLSLKRVPIQYSDGKFLFIARIKGWLLLETILKNFIKKIFQKLKL